MSHVGTVAGIEVGKAVCAAEKEGALAYQEGTSLDFNKYSEFDEHSLWIAYRRGWAQACLEFQGDWS